MEREKETDRGELVVEAMLVMVVVIFALLMVIGVAFIVYQQANVNVVANRAASRVAEIYPLVDQELDDSEITWDSVKDIKLYRYFLKDKLKGANQEKAVAYAKSRLLDKYFFFKPTGDPTFSAKVVHDGMGLRHIEVTVTATYKTPAVASMKFFGLEDIMTYTAVGKADCVDTISYVNTIGYAKDMAGKLGELTPIIGAIDAVRGAIKAIAKLV